MDYVAFIHMFGSRIFHAHMKDVYWSPRPTEAGVFGGHLGFGDRRRFWDFRSVGRGSIDFEQIIRALNAVGEWAQRNGRARSRPPLWICPMDVHYD